MKRPTTHEKGVYMHLKGTLIPKTIQKQEKNYRPVSLMNIVTNEILTNQNQWCVKNTS